MCVKFITFTLLCCCVYGWPSNSENKDEIQKGDFAFPDDLDIGKFSKREMRFPHNHGPEFHDHHHHHHMPFHHSPEYHRNNYPGPEESEIFEEGDEVALDRFNNESTQIPLDYIQTLNEHNVTDLLLDFVDGFEDRQEGFIASRFGDDGTERNAASMPKEANCMPELTTINIASSDDPSILYIPQCTRIERCGGCCRNNLLACQPLKKENVPFKVYKTQYTGAKKLNFLGSELKMVERHTKCKCLCKVQPEDCTKFQEYRESECRCACKNYDDKKKCLKSNETKLWNPDLCTCQCRESIQCSTGSYFDQKECRCLPLPENRSPGSFRRRSSGSMPLPVVPLDEY